MTSSETCTICQEESTLLIRVKPCMHHFHIQCIKEINVPKCPMCRADLTEFLRENGLLNDMVIEHSEREDLTRDAIRELTQAPIRLSDRFERRRPTTTTPFIPTIIEFDRPHPHTHHRFEVSHGRTDLRGITTPTIVNYNTNRVQRDEVRYMFRNWSASNKPMW